MLKDQNNCCIYSNELKFFHLNNLKIKVKLINILTKINVFSKPIRFKHRNEIKNILIIIKTDYIFIVYLPLFSINLG